MKICFIDKTKFSYSFRDINSEKLRGAETVLINLSKQISSLDNKVTVFNNCENEYESKNYNWFNINRLFNNNFDFDLVISNNDTKLLDKFNCKKKFVLSHSIHSLEKFIRKRQLFSYIKNKPVYLLLGKYHQDKMSKIVSLYGTKIINYGVDEIFEKSKIKDNIDHNLCIFTSRQDRNLNLLIDIWKNKIFRSNNNLKLLITPIKDELKKYNIFNRKLSSRIEYINDISNSKLVLLPGHKAELYCLAAAEARELCVPIITLGIGALSERVDHGTTGFIARNNEEFSDYVLEIFNNKSTWQTLRNNLIKLRKNNSWNSAAITFLNKITNRDE